jgi:glutathione S-transferase
MAVTLWGEVYWFSPYVFSAYVALTEKGVPFETKLIDVYSAEQHRTDYQSKTITARVPSLEHDGFWLAESSAIIEYVDETFPGPPLLPKDPKERARARQVMAWIRSDLGALRDEYSTYTMFYEKAPGPLSGAGRAAADKLVAVANRLLPEGAKQLFSTWSCADADLAFCLHRLVSNDYGLPPKVRAYAAEQWKRPSIRAFVEHERPKSGPKPT